MAFDLSTIVLFAFPGMVGGLVRGVIGIGKHVVKNKEPFEIGKLLFSLATAMLAGAFAALITGGDWRISLLAGHAGSDLIDSFRSSLIKKQ